MPSKRAPPLLKGCQKRSLAYALRAQDFVRHWQSTYASLLETILLAMIQ